MRLCFFVLASTLRGREAAEATVAITFHKNDFMHISAMKNFSSIILYDLRLSHSSHRATDRRGTRDEKAATALKSVYTILRENTARQTLLQELRRKTHLCLALSDGVADFNHNNISADKLMATVIIQGSSPGLLLMITFSSSPGRPRHNACCAAKKAICTRDNERASAPTIVKMRK